MDADEVLDHAWEATWRDLGHEAPPGLRARLEAAWTEAHRRYHTPRHLAECFGHLEAARGLAQRPGELGAALWFHDAVYDVHRKDSEERSAVWAVQALEEAGVPAEAARRTGELVLATRHDAAPAAGDAALLVDIDLAILGADEARFDEYEAQVRQEYSHVPDPAFRAGRGAILRAFLARPAIYGTALFRGRLEARARANLQRSLARAA